MIVQLARNCILALAALTLSSIALAQPPAQPAAPASTPPTTQAAPIERHPPSGQTGRDYQPGRRPGMMQSQHSRGEFHGGSQFHRDSFRGGQGFHGSEGGPMGGGFHIGPPGMWWKNPMAVQRLTLTPDQVKKMDGIVQESRLQLIDLRANLEKQQVLLEPMLSANPLDTAKAMAQIDKVAQSRADLEKANAKMLLGIRGVLTPDQWTKLSSRQGPDGGPGGPDGQAAPSPNGGRGRSPRGGGPPPATDDLVAPIDIP